MHGDRPAVRLRLDLGYDGRGFSGWAMQPGRRTVEGELSASLARVLRLPGPLRLVAAGRTDAGVHARGAVAHCDVPDAAWLALPGRSPISPEQSAVRRLRAVLEPDMVVRSVAVAPPGFDARFSAMWRRYTYRLADRPEHLDPLRRWDTAVHRRDLDVAEMAAAAQALVGLRDFAAFCRPRAGATTVRTLMEFGWRRGEDAVLVATVRADAFCHSMVRFLVGATVAVGEGRVSRDLPLHVLQAGLRDSRFPLMPAHGLCLEEVGYPPPDLLAARAAEARARRGPSHEVAVAEEAQPLPH